MSARPLDWVEPKKNPQGLQQCGFDMARLARFERATAWFVAQQMKFNVLF